MDTEQKDLLTSKTFWGAIVGALAAMLKFYEIEIDEQGLTTGIVAVAGFAVTVWGRIKSTKQIGSVGGVKTKAGKEA